MITANGKQVVKRFLTGKGQLAAAMSVGAGSAAPTVNDSRLAYEVERINIASVSVDPDSDRVVFRAILPPGRIKEIHEVGLWANPISLSSGRTLGTFGTNTWANATLTNAHGRVNQNTLQVSYSANGTTNAELIGINEDLSIYSSSDSLVVGYYVTINLSSVRVRLGRDASNYFEFVLPAATANSYNVARLALSAAAITGTPSWSDISYIAVRPSATAAGAGNLFLDGIRVEQNSINEGNILVARSVLTTPYVVNQTIDNDIEYALEVSIA